MRLATCSRSNVVNKYCFVNPLFREQVVFSLILSCEQEMAVLFKCVI